MSGHFLIVEARFYEALADAQAAGADPRSDGGWSHL